MFYTGRSLNAGRVKAHPSHSKKGKSFVVREYARKDEGKSPSKGGKPQKVKKTQRDIVSERQWGKLTPYERKLQMAAKQKFRAVMKQFKEGKLRPFVKHAKKTGKVKLGPIVTNPQQAWQIATWYRRQALNANAVTLEAAAAMAGLAPFNFAQLVESGRAV